MTKSVFGASFLCASLMLVACSKPNGEQATAVVTADATAGAEPTPTELARGRELYGQPGAFSCVYCHGVKGDGGRIENAAQLTRPTTWKSFAELGGASEYARDPALFRQKLSARIEEIIRMGAPARPGWNALMMGLRGAPSQRWLNDKGVKASVAARWVRAYIEEFDGEQIWRAPRAAERVSPSPRKPPAKPAPRGKMAAPAASATKDRS